MTTINVNTNTTNITNWARQAWEVLTPAGVEPATLHHRTLDGHVVTVQKWEEVSCSICCGSGCDACGNTGVAIERGSMSVYLTFPDGSMRNTSPRSLEGLNEFLGHALGDEATAITRLEGEGWKRFHFFSSYYGSHPEREGDCEEDFLFRPGLDLSRWAGTGFAHGSHGASEANRAWDAWFEGLVEGEDYYVL